MKEKVIWFGVGSIIVVGLYLFVKREIKAPVRALNETGAEIGQKSAQQWNDGKFEVSDIPAALFETWGRLTGDIPWGGFNGLQANGRRRVVRRRQRVAI